MISRLATVVLLVLAVTACGRQAAGPGSAAAPAPTPRVAAGAFGPTERAFVELAIATDDAAVALLDLGSRRAAATPLRDLARDLGTVRRAELAELHGLLDTERIAYVDNHAGHDMPGMPTGAELQTLAASDIGFDPAFVRLLRAHLNESATVLRSALGSVTHQPTRTVASRMEQERTQALRRLAEVSGPG